MPCEESGSIRAWNVWTTACEPRIRLSESKIAYLDERRHLGVGAVIGVGW